jgi:hypothetical protein
VELDAAQDTEGDGRDRRDDREDVLRRRGLGYREHVVSPIRPSVPGTRSQNPGRKTAYTGIVDGGRASR